MPATGLYRWNRCLCRPGWWRATGSARLSVFSAPEQAATGEEMPGSAGRKPIRASAVIPDGVGQGASVSETPVMRLVPSTSATGLAILFDTQRHFLKKHAVGLDIN